MMPNPFLTVVSYRNSTSNHNFAECFQLNKNVVSYRNSTSNHNVQFGRISCVSRCILSKFYIKPQQCRGRSSSASGCILSKFYIKPQLESVTVYEVIGCILSKFYIKPQPWLCVVWTQKVVSYRNSTSNHNFTWGRSTIILLYLIEILHQTTTTCTQSEESGKLYLIEILHQTTTAPGAVFECDQVVSYRNSTSNHNVGPHID